MTQPKPNRILMVAQSFPPVGGSHATRTLALAHHLAQSNDLEGVAPEIGDQYPMRSKVADLPFSVHRTYPGPAHALAHGRAPDATNDVPATPSDSQSSRAFANLLGYAKQLYRSWEVIDSYFDWIPSLAKEVRKLTTDPRVYVVSLSMPNSAHVGTRLALLGRKNFWTVDIADPWTLNRSVQRSRIRLLLESMLEKSILHRADAVVFVTRSTRDDYIKKYPAIAKKTHIFRMGYSIADTGIEPKEFPNFTVFYGGSIPSENRDATNIATVIQKLPEISFFFAGPCTSTISQLFEGGTPTNVTLLPWLSHSEFVAYMRGADVSLILGNSNTQQVPGKVYQAAGLSRRILYVGTLNRAEDESWEILQSRATWSGNSSQEIADALRVLMSSEPSSDDPLTYSWERILVNYPCGEQSKSRTEAQ